MACFLSKRVSSASWGGAIGLGYVPCKGEKLKGLLASSYEIDVAGTKHAAEASSKPLYDPKSERPKA